MVQSMTDKDFKSATSRVGADVSTAVNEAGEKMTETVENVKNAAAANFDKVEAAIRRNPIAAASIAGGVGFLLAVLARR